MWLNDRRHFGVVSQPWGWEATMNRSIGGLCLGMALCTLPGAAHSALLSVVTVSAPNINCVFETDCTIEVTDSVFNIPVPGATGTARLQSRTFAGKPGAPAAGKTGYEYRVDLTQSTPIGDSAC